MNVVRLVMVLPLLVVWVLAMLDVVTRNDLRRSRKVLELAALLLFFPLTLLYLLARPTSIARDGDLPEDDWREGLVARLDGDTSPANGSAPPAPVGELLGRVRRAAGL